MLKKTIALAALAGATLLASAPALADGYRHGRGHNDQGPKRIVVVQQHAPHYAQRHWDGNRRHGYRQAYAHQRPMQVRHAPVMTYRRHSSHDVLGGLIVGAMIGAVIANHAGY